MLLRLDTIQMGGLLAQNKISDNDETMDVHKYVSSVQITECCINTIPHSFARNKTNEFTEHFTSE